MLGFVIASGIFSIIVGDITCYLVLSKLRENRGFVGCREVNKNGLAKNILGFLVNFIPVVNLLATAFIVYKTCKLLKSNETEINDFFNEIDGMHNAVYAKKLIDSNKKLYDENSIRDAMILDGVDKTEINKQLKLMNKETPTIYMDNKYNKKIDAMSDAELWLQSVYMDAGLSLEEKRQLFSSYTKDFMKNRPLGKGKVLKKTIEMTSTHKYK